MDKKEKQEKIERMRKESGTVKIKNKLVCFLYILLRDEVTPGRIETLMEQQKIEDEVEHLYTNGWLARYAENLANRLTNA